MSRIAAFLALATLGLGAHVAHAQNTVNRWIQYGPNNTVLARAITTGGTCPALSVDGASIAMTVRSAPTATFPVTECEAQVVSGNTATIDGVQLRLPVANPRRIVVIGDTGCRLKSPSSYQACNDPTAFPLARLSNYAASFRPDLIIHVGDFYYRESPCPAGNTGCAGSPTGDNWASWNADWFGPAQPLMAAAPLALTRGNHESCARGQNGWFTLLDPSSYSAAAVTCAAGSSYDFTAPYVVKAGQASLLMFDSSYANDTAFSSMTVSTYQAQLTSALSGITGSAIFVTHKPAYGLVSSTGAGASAVVTGGNTNEQTLFTDGVPNALKLLLSGHIHNFEAVKVTNAAYAPQLVVGNSGTLLDPTQVPGNQAGGTYTMPGAGTSATIQSTSDTSEFGFAVLDLVPGGYVANLYDLNGTPHGRCAVQLAARNLVCGS